MDPIDSTASMLTYMSLRQPQIQESGCSMLHTLVGATDGVGIPQHVVLVGRNGGVNAIRRAMRAFRDCKFWGVGALSVLQRAGYGRGVTLTPDADSTQAVAEEQPRTSRTKAPRAQDSTSKNSALHEALRTIERLQHAVKELESSFECSICMEQFDSTHRAPRVLSCGHTHCEECLHMCFSPCFYLK